MTPRDLAKAIRTAHNTWDQTWNAVFKRHTGSLVNAIAAALHEAPEEMKDMQDLIRILLIHDLHQTLDWADAVLSKTPSDARALMPLDDDRLACSCGSADFRYVETAAIWWPVKNVADEVLQMDGLYKVYDEGSYDPRLQCASCMQEYRIPNNFHTEFL